MADVQATRRMKDGEGLEEFRSGLRVDGSPAIGLGRVGY